MSVRWSSENVVAEHRDLQATTMAVDWRGELTLLAGRRSLALISLDKPTEVVERVNRTQQKYDVTAAEWNPTQERGNMFALTCGERAELSERTGNSISSIASLRAHTRTITDLNWHQKDPNLLATCSIDTFVHIWDTRDTRKPATSLSTVAGASQVKWNKVNPNLIASGHDCDIRLWDHRKSSQPTYIAAHLSKIQGLDWSPHHENHIVTSSSDCTVKFFDISNPRRPENSITTRSPVWRARYTPFGEGIITIIVPQLRRGENSLLLWSVTDVSSPVHTFVGHSDVVLEFEWRKRQTTDQHQDFQLVTWARDHSLRIWKIDQNLQKLCGYHCEEDVLLPLGPDVELSTESALLPEVKADGQEEVENEVVTEDHFGEQEIITSQTIVEAPTEEAVVNGNGTLTTETIEKDELKSPSPQPSNMSSGEETPVGTTTVTSSVTGSGQVAAGVSSSLGTVPSQPMSLQQEFSLLNTSLESGQVNSVEVTTDAEKRWCQVTAKYSVHLVCLNVTFPSGYPKTQSPYFRFSVGTTIDSNLKAELLRGLKNAAAQFLKRKKACLEPCIRILISQMEHLLGEERINAVEASLNSTNSGGMGNYMCPMYGSYQDHSVPFPRTSGARFCSAGMLVCFTRPTFMKRGGSSRTESSTPRSFSALSAYVANLIPPMSSNVPTSPKFNYMYPGLAQSPSAEQCISISQYYYQDKKMKSKRGRNEEEIRTIRSGRVFIYDATPLMPLSRELGVSYKIDENDLVGTCNHNRDVAATVGRKDLVQVWSLAAAIAYIPPGNTADTETPWAHHPFARKLINSWFDHYLQSNDVQTAAMLSCVFGIKAESQHQAFGRKSRNESSSHMRTFGSLRRLSKRQTSVMAKLERLSPLRGPKTGGSPYNTIHGLNMSLDGLDMCMVRHNRSNSEGSLSDAARPSQEVEHPAIEATDLQDKAIKFLDPARSQQYDELRRVYADVLYRWDLLEQRAMVLKYMQIQPAVHKGVEFQSLCVYCDQSGKSPRCLYCKRFSFSCAICHVAVRGYSKFCVVCGHGGHTYHLFQWFKDHRECPTGCGCDCINEMVHLFR